MPLVELIYDSDCPNADEARAELMRAFAQAGLPARWHEWRTGDSGLPAHVAGHGSPTILIDGADVSAGAAAQPGARSCRIYTGDDGRSRGTPAAAAIARALIGGGAPGRLPRSGWRGTVAIVPAIALALLPKVACPACWPAYAGVLSAAGLGFLLDTAYLLPVTAAAMVIAVGALAFRAGRRRGYRPFLLGALAAAVVLVGKFVFDSDPAMYVGVAALVAASVWNSWPRQTSSPSCSSCAPAVATTQGIPS